jgi:hypothetical protein
VIPVALVDDRLRVAMSNHLDLKLIDRLRLKALRNIDSIPASKESILAAIDCHYGHDSDSDVT